MFRASRHILILLLMAALAAIQPLLAPAKDKNSRPKPPVPTPSGNYNVTVAGALTGNGGGTASSSSVSIYCSVTDSNGNSGQFAANANVDARLHFTGTGNALGQSLTLRGRLDPVPSDDAALKTNRLVGTFKLADGTHGRIVGFMTVNPNGPAGGDPGNGDGTPPPKPQPKPQPILQPPHDD
jgi:hypothetical protein